MAKEQKYKILAIAEMVALAAIFFIFLTYKLPGVINYVFSLNPKVKIQQEIIKNQEKRIQFLTFDNVRNDDMTNILLAIQDLINEKNVIPASLEILKETGYLSNNQVFSDPETGKAYYFKPLENNFVFCVYLSDRVKGFNINLCPEQLSFVENYQLASLAYSTDFRMLFTIIWTLGALLITCILFSLIKFFN